MSLQHHVQWGRLSPGQPCATSPTYPKPAGKSFETCNQRCSFPPTKLNVERPQGRNNRTLVTRRDSVLLHRHGQLSPSEPPGCWSGLLCAFSGTGLCGWFLQQDHCVTGSSVTFPHSDISREVVYIHSSGHVSRPPNDPPGLTGATTVSLLSAVSPQASQVTPSVWLAYLKGGFQGVGLILMKSILRLCTLCLRPFVLFP